MDAPAKTVTGYFRDNAFFRDKHGRDMTRLWLEVQPGTYRVWTLSEREGTALYMHAARLPGPVTLLLREDGSPFLASDNQ